MKKNILFCLVIASGLASSVCYGTQRYTFFNASSKRLHFYVAHGQGCADEYFPLHKDNLKDYEKGTGVNDCPIRGMIITERAVVKNDIKRGFFSQLFSRVTNLNPNNTIVFQWKWTNNDYKPTNIVIKFKDIKKPLKVKLDPKKWENDGKFKEKFKKVGWRPLNYEVQQTDMKN